MSTLIAYLNRRNLLNVGWILAALGWLAVTLSVTLWIVAYETSDVLDWISVGTPIATATIIALLVPPIAAASWRQNTEPLLSDLGHRGVHSIAVAFASILSSWIAALLILAMSAPAAIWATVAGDRHWFSLGIAYGIAALTSLFAVSLGQLMGAWARSASTAVGVSLLLAVLALAVVPLVSFIPTGGLHRVSMLLAAGANPALVIGGLLPSAPAQMEHIFTVWFDSSRIGSLTGLAIQLLCTVAFLLLLSVHCHTPRRRMPRRRRIG
jgi:hypothetical protein